MVGSGSPGQKPINLCSIHDAAKNLYTSGQKEDKSQNSAL